MHPRFSYAKSGPYIDAEKSMAQKRKEAALRCRCHSERDEKNLRKGGMDVRLLGYRKSDFSTKEGVEITGYSLYIATEIDPRNGKGLAVERSYITDAKIANEHIELEKLFDKDVKV